MNEELKNYLDKEFGSIHEEIADLRDEVIEVSQSVNNLASHMDERFEEMVPVLSSVEGHEKRLKYLEDKLPKLA